MKTVFWISCGFALYAYVLYPMGIAALAALLRRDRERHEVSGAKQRARVSVIICARNEAARIRDRLENLCRQDYDPSLYEVIVVSDGSTDGTGEAVKQFRDEHAAHSPVIRLIEKPVSCGKAAGLNDAVAVSSGEVIVMADARQKFGGSEEDCRTVTNLVASFSSPDVGCVSGELMFTDADSGALQTDLGAYWRYEKWIRKNESAVDSVPGVTGAVYAMRRELFEELPPATLLDDVLIPMRAILRGYRVIFDGKAVARDRVSAHSQQEWRRKVRTLAGNWQLVSLIPCAFLPWKNRIWIQFISHKILRLLVPFALIAALLTSLLIPGPLYRFFAAIQVGIYACAALAAIAPGLQRVRLLSVCYTFVLLNLAAVAGFGYWATGQSRAVWSVATGKSP